MRIIIIAAMTRDRVIGDSGRIPWHETADLRHFKRTTTGHGVIMGRRTFESIGRPLPNRRNIVLTRNRSYVLPDPAPRHLDVDLGPSIETQAMSLSAAHSLDEALERCGRYGEQRVFVIGGAQIYAQTLPIVKEMIITHIERHDIAGDAYFPRWNASEWEATPLERDARLRIVRYRRR
ncbi:MAG: dihydrofolate reductase [Phycisphaerae bacterium]